ncbi:MAG: hypothetical protein RLZZ336_2033, partial [Cyanobacteriota bacterium]
DFSQVSDHAVEQLLQADRCPAP